MRVRWVLASLLAAGLAAAGAAPIDSSRLTVRVTGLRSDQGRVAIAIFDSSGAFESRANPLRSALLPVQGSSCEWVVEDLPAGEYAVMLYHDTNDNGKLDKKSFGMPKEPYGFSNNARAPLGPPPFEAARFELADDVTLEIEAR